MSKIKKEIGKEEPENGSFFVSKNWRSKKMKLIIAEKPGLAKLMLEGISSSGKDHFENKDGYFEGNEYIISYTFGHLFTMMDMEKYLDKPEGSPWSMDVLPFVPEKFKYTLTNVKGKVDPGIKKQFNTLKTLLNRDDVDEIINLGDADREGEVLIREILNFGLSDKSKKITRIWAPDQSPDQLFVALQNRKLDSEYDNIYKEGLIRGEQDWTDGINLTRYLSIKCGELLRVGRVNTAVVKIIYDRELAIEKFIPKKFYQLISKEKTSDIEIQLVYKENYSKDQLEAAKNKCLELNQNKAVVKDIKSKKVIKQPPKLFSMTKCQAYCGKKYKLSPKQTFDSVVSLYDKGYISYPRTETEYLGEGDKDRVKAIIQSLLTEGDKVVFKDKKSIFDNSKIESHGALTPTSRRPDLNNLSANDKLVYETILNRFKAVFCSEDCILNKSEMIITMGNEEFILKGEMLLQPGYLQYEKEKASDKQLPNLKIGDVVNINFKPIEKETTPPKRYTTSTLMNYCINPFKKKDMTEDENYNLILAGVSIGTGATRAPIIENAIANGYISVNNDVYKLEGLGRYLIETMQKLEIDMSIHKTIEQNKLLKKVNSGELSLAEARQLYTKSIKENFSGRDKAVDKVPDELKRSKGKQSIGKCPKCGKSVCENKKAFSCSGYKEGCKFAIWKEDKFFASLGVKTVTKSRTYNTYI